MRITILLLLLMGFSLSGATQGNEPVLTFSDEFDGTGSPDASKWDRPEYNRRNNANGPDGYWSNDDSYLDGNGNLIIRVRKIDNKNNDDDAYDYSTGVVRTKGKFEQLYGRYEIRCQLPTQPGWWVAFWMMQGNVGSEANLGVDGSEVDIMEGFGWTDKINNAIHYDGYGDAHKSKEFNKVYAGIREGFHVYALDWTPDVYIFYMDSVEVWRSTGGGVCNKPGYIKITGEISTEEWAINQWWSNDPATASYPDSFIVDYVRVYQMEYTNTSSSEIPLHKNSFQVYPNPVKDHLKLEWASESSDQLAVVTIRDASGLMQREFKLSDNQSELYLGDLRKGIYMLSVQQNEQQQFFRILKN